VDGDDAPLCSPVEDLGPGDFVKVDWAACSHTALLSMAPIPARPQPTAQSARPKRPRTVWRLWCAGPGGRVDHVGEVSRLIPLGVAETKRADADRPTGGLGFDRLNLPGRRVRLQRAARDQEMPIPVMACDNAL
jgi:hypothetical protein